MQARDEHPMTPVIPCQPYPEAIFAFLLSLSLFALDAMGTLRPANLTTHTPKRDIGENPALCSFGCFDRI
jgi:hypothetical protein